MFQNGANIDAKDKYGYSTFDLTDKYKNIKLRDTLQTIKNGTSPLLCAVEDSHTETIKLLLTNGADIEAENNDGDTSLLKGI